MRCWQRVMLAGVQVHSCSLSLDQPQGHGFIAATSWKLAGKVSVPWARESGNDVSFARLAHDFKGALGKLGKLVQEKDAAMLTKSHLAMENCRRQAGVVRSWYHRPILR
jgi:hypothetical protein